MGTDQRTVTILTSDLQGSTSLGERLDPESLREVISHYFDAMVAVIEAHGGTVEKFSGDAILAIFESVDAPGSPADPATAARRAVQAAAETQRTLAALNERLDATWGVRLTNRTGVATGELVVGAASHSEHILSGGVVGLATALEQAAPANDVLIDTATLVRVSDQAIVEQVPSVRIKGREDDAAAYHVLSVASLDLADVSPDTDAQAAHVLDSRKTVTIVFADIHPTASDESALDPSVVRDVMALVFEVAQSALLGHGGTVEKYIGDAVMAVFGLPVRHEDDALRAVRAASDLRDALRRLRADRFDAMALRLHIAIGVNTGHVVAGDHRLGQRLVTGDAVNVAARLEQAAPADAILIGELTRRLVGDAAEVREVEPLALKGKAEPVRAYELTRLAAHAETRPMTPLVGRERELATLDEAFQQAVAMRAPRMVTLVGDAGVGKTRLTTAFLERVAADAQVLRGRCLPYGDGITFWPIAEVVRSAAAIEPTDEPSIARARLLRVCDDEQIVDRVASAIGLATTPYQVQELFWGIRRFLAHLAAAGPLVVVLDDIHWAEATFLELIGHLTQSTEDAPILILCGSRTTLIERDPTWATGDLERRIDLGPMSDADAGRVAESQLGGATLDSDVRARIVAAAEGNPLFVEQLLSMLLDDGSIELRDGRWRAASDLSAIAIPPTIHALLAARLDQLPEPERAVVDPASVIGLQFARAALASLVDAATREGLDPRLASLGDRQFVRPLPDPASDGPTYRFGHILIRDATYEGLLKRTRAELHERFVAWADEANRAADRATEFEEILGYHLEQAHRYLGELGPYDEHGIAVGIEASRRLAAAGGRAADRGDVAAARNLLGRAVALLPVGQADRPRLLLEVGDATFEAGDHAEADAAFVQAATEADALGDVGLATAARLAALQAVYLTDPSRIEGPVEPQVRAYLRTLEALGDHAGQARAWQFLGNLEYARARWSAAADATREVLHHARIAGDEVMEIRGGPYLAIFATEGAMPVPDAIALAESVLARSATDRKAQAMTERALARLLALRGEPDRARATCERARRTLEELGWTFTAALTSMDAAQIEMVAGDAARAERELRRDYATLERLGDRNFITTVAAFLADATWRQGDIVEADRFAAFSAETADPDDEFTQMLWRQVRARLLSGGGRHDEAIATAGEAVTLSRGSDDLIGQANALRDLATVLTAAGRPDDAQAAAAEATTLYERKGAIAYLAIEARQ